RKEIAQATKIAQGGNLSLILEELVQCGFIQEYHPFGKKKRGSLFQLIDFYSLFYLKFVDGSRAIGQGTWLAQIDHPGWRAWSGYAFENVCRYHLNALKTGLGISGVYTEISAWKSREAGVQIDLVIDRRDRVINLCEIKFSQAPFTISKSYAANLLKKVQAFKTETGTSKTIFLTIVTLLGLKENAHSLNVVQQQVRMDQHFFQ
ncbi:MAG: ATP-binding protein, partial [Bacteroidota bacterium]